MNTFYHSFASRATSTRLEFGYENMNQAFVGQDMWMAFREYSTLELSFACGGSFLDIYMMWMMITRPGAVGLLGDYYFVLVLE